MNTDQLNYLLAIRTQMRSVPALFGPYTLDEANAYRQHLLGMNPPLADVSGGLPKRRKGKVQNENARDLRIVSTRKT